MLPRLDLEPDRERRAPTIRFQPQSGEGGETGGSVWARGLLNPDRAASPRSNLLVTRDGVTAQMQRMPQLTEAEREWAASQRARPCKHGHGRHDARVYR